MKVAIIGGGPSGLYLGLLLKREQPDWRVEVVEQNQADDTFGFGVVLADSGLAQLQEADVLLGLLEKETRIGGATAQRVATGLLGVLLAKSAQWMRGALICSM